MTESSFLPRSHFKLLFYADLYLIPGATLVAPAHARTLVRLQRRLTGLALRLPRSANFQPRTRWRHGGADS